MKPALIGFIRKNYTYDTEGHGYFQNGPQRGYLDLETAPYVARTTPPSGFMLQTDEPMRNVEAAWLTENGRLFLQDRKQIALLDDRDFAECLGMLRKGTAAATEDDLHA